jgi:UDP-N-acetylmuramoyl-L-alanine---L-glutamate ligase
MINYIKKNIADKKILILGFGKEGQSTYELLRRALPSQIITIADLDKEIEKKNPSLVNDNNLNLILGESYLDHLSDFDIIFKTPGISLKDINYSFDVEKILTQTDLFLKIFSKQVIGITGTKGKSTTSSSIYHILSLQNSNVVLVGNIGIPPFTMLSKIDKETRILCELSSHQLEYISIAPHISVLLNLYQEHLDHYISFEHYQLAKWNITLHQNIDDYFIFNSDDSLINDLVKKNNLERKYFPFSAEKSVENGCYLQDEKIYFSKDCNTNCIFDSAETPFLVGSHNLLNLMAAINVCKILDVPDNIIIEGIKTFKGLPHRIEYVGLYHNIHFYNDSISTIPQATIQAVEALKNVDTLILGGFDRGIDYSGLIDYLAKSNINHLIFIADAGKRMLEILKKNFPEIKDYDYVDSMESAVNIAMQKTQPEKICLLSPAAASYGMFKNFEERGDIFKKLIKKV